jgi:diacylglycerol kinase (ATP)
LRDRVEPSPGGHGICTAAVQDGDMQGPPLPVPAKNRPFKARLGFALSGIRTVARREKSFRTQLALGAASVAALLGLRPSLLWAALVLLSTGLVLALEAVEIGHAKDAAAGAVLIASLAAAAVGALMVAASLPASAP